MNQSSLTPARVLLFAFAAGVLIANLYYVQPLTALLANTFDIPVTWGGYLVTATQIGYVFGVLLIVPLSDVIDRRFMLTLMLGLNIGALLMATLSQNFFTFALASVLIGLSTSAVMVILPMAASMAPEASRGKVLGTVMSGLLMGILLARTVAGAMADLSGGWRPMYLAAAVVGSVLVLALRRGLSQDEARAHVPYRVLMQSLVALVRQEPQLRQRSLFAGLGFATFSLFWTGLTFLLHGSPYHYNEMQIGLFGLIGVAGAFAANFAGRTADRGHTSALTWLFAGLMLLSWGFIAAGGHSLWSLILGIFLLDVGVMGMQVTHQTIIYKLAPGARARITTIFIASSFIGAATGSGIASLAYATGGWALLSVAGAAAPLALLVVWTMALRRNQAAAAAQGGAAPAGHAGTNCA
jgi:predicted MFS family arabinose efflux permease